MYDDYEIEFHENDYGFDEDSYYENHTQDLHEDDDYARDAQDYESLAYRHYAWYNTHKSHEMLMIAQKRKVSVTLYVECYDDLDLEDINWREVLDLQGDESVHASIKDLDPFWGTCQFLYWHNHYNML